MIHYFNFIKKKLKCIMNYMIVANKSMIEKHLISTKPDVFLQPVVLCAPTLAHNCDSPFATPMRSLAQNPYKPPHCFPAAGRTSDGCISPSR